MSSLRLRVNNLEHSGWTSVRVTRSIECIAGSFEVGLTDRWSGMDEPWPIVEQDKCTLLLGDEVVIVGHVDRRNITIGPSERSLTVAGRDATGDLVDCSAIDSVGDYLNVSLESFVERIVEPFALTVWLQEDPEVWRIPRKIAKLSVDPGDTAFEAIERACRMVGLLPVSDGHGGLLLTRAGIARAATALVEGENILGASVEYDATGRYARYLVTGQRQGTDLDYGAAVAAVQGSARDAGVRWPARSLMVRAETGVTPELAMDRAEWEATVRAARGTAVKVTVQGWTQENGKLWPVNVLVPLWSPSLGLKSEMLISQVTFNLSEGGTTTELTLKRRDAFQPQPEVPEMGSGTWPELTKGPVVRRVGRSAPARGAPWSPPKF